MSCTEDDWAGRYRDLLTEANNLRHEVARLREDIAAVRRVCEHPADAVGRTQGLVVNGDRLARRVLGLLD